jgi:hypothetical protein
VANAATKIPAESFIFRFSFKVLFYFPNSPGIKEGVAPGLPKPLLLPLRFTMQFSFDIASSTANPIQAPQQQTSDSVPELLRLILEQQREQLNQILEIQK